MILESAAYGMKNNSRKEPDFKTANIEIKATGLKYSTKKNVWRFKERLSIGQVNFFDYVNETFFDSEIMKKMNNILLVGYEYCKGLSPIDSKIILIYPLKFTKEEYKIMENDFNIGKKLVEEGKAEKISEKLFQILAINTKGKNSNDMVGQPHSSTLVKRRGWSLKNSFLNKKISEIIDNCDDEVKKYFYKEE